MARELLLMTMKLTSLALSGVVCWIHPSTISASEWPIFRGPQGTGIVSKTSAPLDWSDKDNVLWRVPMPGPGNSTPIVWNDQVFVTQYIEQDARRVLMCYRLNDGERLWQAGITFEDKEPTNMQNPYCAASPATDGEHVIAFFGSPGLYCYDMTGNELWHRDLGDVDSWHGSGSSPIIHDGVCYLNFGPGSESALIACDVKTGDVLWTQKPPREEGGFRFGPPGGGRRPRGDRPRGGPPRPPGGGPEEPQDADASTPFANAGRSGDFSGKGGFNGSWCTPVVLDVDGHEELVVVESGQVAAYDPKSGEQLWKCGGLPQQVFASPAIGEGVIVAMGHRLPSGTEIVAVKQGGNGDVTETHKLWGASFAKECIASGVIAHGHLFLAADTGFAMCFDLSTGDKKWEKRIRGKGSRGGVWSSLVLCDDKLLISNLSGEVFLFAASPEYKLLDTNYVGDETMCASPVVLDDRLLLRTYDALWCVGTPE